MSALFESLLWRQQFDAEMHSEALWMDNLKKPEGFFGELIGEYLAQDFYETNMWAIHLLDIQEGEKILEIGFGPGIAVEEVIKTTAASFVGGFDYSELMVAAAKKRNTCAVQEGKVDLRHGNVISPPSFGILFDKCVVINNIMYWPKPIVSLKKVRGMLKPGGFISLVFHREQKQFLAGLCHDEICQYISLLERAGFSDIQVATQALTVERELLKPYQLTALSVRGFSPILSSVPQD
jgi:ubiquinone/menaquinone biosynthesis C-methylase UbiE